MRKWLTIGGLVMLCLWVPFLYDELTSSPTEKKGRALPADDPSQEGVGETTSGAAGAGKASTATPAEPAAEATAQPEPQKDPPAPTPSTKAAAPSAQPEVKAEPPFAGAAEGEPATDDEQADAPAPPPVAAGPTTVLKRAFETQPRDPLWAADTEAHVRALFRGGDMPPELLQSASCRKAVCRLELRWTHERATAYVSLYETVHKDFGGEVGVEPLGAPDDKGQEQVNLYLARKGYTVADLAK